MNPINNIPNLNWSDHSQAEIDRSSERLVKESSFAYQLGEAAIVGLIYSSFTSDPWLWFALAKDVTLGDLLDFRRLKEKIPSGTHTCVKKDYEIGHRFATFYGFSRTGQEMNLNDIDYEVYRKV